MDFSRSHTRDASHAPRHKDSMLSPSSPVPRSHSSSSECCSDDACATTSPTRRMDAKQEDELDEELMRVQQMANTHNNMQSHGGAGRRSRSVDPSPPPASDEPNCIPTVAVGGCSDHGRPS